MPDEARVSHKLSSALVKANELFDSLPSAGVGFSSCTLRRHATTGFCPRVLHPGVDDTGEWTAIPGPCLFDENDGTMMGSAAGQAEPPTTYSELQATYDLDITHIERTPRYQAPCVGLLGCSSPADTSYSWCPAVPDLQLGPQCEETSVTVGQCKAYDGKRWPSSGEPVTYIAHIVNKGGVTSPRFNYEWRENGTVVASDLSDQGLAPGLGGEQTVTLSANWRGFDPPWFPGTIEFAITSMEAPAAPDAFASNNSRIIDTHAVSAIIYATQSIYSEFNTRAQSDLTGTFSYEDWMQFQFSELNLRLASATYPIVAPQGIRERVRIDRFVVVDDSSISIPQDPHLEQLLLADLLVNARTSDPDFRCKDGWWQTAEKGIQAPQSPSNYHESNIDKIDNDLLHELGHFLLNLIDLYNINLPAEPNYNWGVEVRRDDGTLLSLDKPCPFDPEQVCSFCGDLGPDPCPLDELAAVIWEEKRGVVPGIMGGSDSYPYNDLNAFDRHSAAALNVDFLKRKNGEVGRGPFGSFLLDTPSRNYLRVIDESGSPISEARVRLYQRSSWATCFPSPNGCFNINMVDNEPEFDVVTNGLGIVELAARAVHDTSSDPAPTGHIVSPNPFGEIHFPGTNGLFLVWVTKGASEWFHFLTVVDLNLAYWSGSTEVGVYTLGPCSPIQLDVEDSDYWCKCVRRGRSRGQQYLASLPQRQHLTEPPAMLLCRMEVS